MNIMFDFLTKFILKLFSRPGNDDDNNNRYRVLTIRPPHVTFTPFPRRSATILLDTTIIANR